MVRPTQDPYWKDGYCVVLFPLRIDLVMTLVYRVVSPMERCLSPPAGNGRRLHTVAGRGSPSAGNRISLAERRCPNGLLFEPTNSRTTAGLFLFVGFFPWSGIRLTRYGLSDHALQELLGRVGVEPGQGLAFSAAWRCDPSIGWKPARFSATLHLCRFWASLILRQPREDISPDLWKVLPYLCKSLL